MTEHLTPAQYHALLAQANPTPGGNGLRAVAEDRWDRQEAIKQERLRARGVLPPLQDERPAEENPKRKNNPERDAQQAFYQWRDLQLGKYPRLAAMFAIPNHGKRSKLGNWMEKLAGLRKGAADNCYPVQARGYTALFIELKVGRNKPTPDQLAFLEMQRSFGACGVVCWGDAAMRRVIEWYEMGIGECPFNEQHEVK